MEWFACVVNNVNFITWSARDQVKAKFCFNSSGGGGGGDFIARPGSHVKMFGVGRFMCKERVMLIEREIRLLFSVNKWCFVTYKQVMRQSSMASHETFGAFYWLSWQLELCNKGRNLKGSG